MPVLTIQTIVLSTIIAGCIIGHQSLPDTAFRRRLNRLYRVGDICIKRKSQRKGAVERKIYPHTPAKAVWIYPDRIEAKIRLPDGMDPKMIWDHEFLFKQMFGEYAHLKQETDRLFTFTLYPFDLKQFKYNFEKIRPMLSGMMVPIYAGRTRTGEVFYDMADYPNLLIAGEPGGGKSVALRSILTTFLLEIGHLRLFCADMKRSEFHLFEGIAEEVVYDEDGLLPVLEGLVEEASARGDLLNKHKVAHVKDLPPADQVPVIILAIDEVALLEEKATFKLLKKLAATGRALGIFLILSMQRPDRETLNSYIKNCLTVRMAFRHGDITNSQISLGPGHGEAADIKPSQKGRMALLLEGIEFAQMPLLELEPARILLQPIKDAKVELEKQPKKKRTKAEPEEQDFELKQLGLSQAATQLDEDYDEDEHPIDDIEDDEDELDIPQATDNKVLPFRKKENDDEDAWMR